MNSIEAEGSGGQKMEIVFTNIGVKKGERQILQDISGVASPGQLLSVMGPSGGGKTTLLNVLAGREAFQTGQVKVNGVTLNKDLKRKVSYVLQEDVFFPNLTLRETLSFTAMLRLPDRMNKKEKMKKMDQIIDELDIRKCLDTIMGDAWCRGLSGGEKKRASIACELITDPAIIFMDLAYFGPCANVINFFSNAGFPMESHYNPADFIIEKLKEKAAQTEIISAAKKLSVASKSNKALKSC